MSDTSTEVVERLTNQRDYNRRLVEHQKTVIDRLNAERDALAAELAEARGALDRIDVIAEVADAAPLCMGEIRELIKVNRALKSEPAPRHSDDECLRCGSVGGFGCYECIPDPQVSTRDRLLDERARLSNNFGLGPFEDGRTRDRIAEIDRKLDDVPVSRQSVQEAARVLLSDDVFPRSDYSAYIPGDNRYEVSRQGFQVLRAQEAQGDE